MSLKDNLQIFAWQKPGVKYKDEASGARKRQFSLIVVCGGGDGIIYLNRRILHTVVLHGAGYVQHNTPEDYFKFMDEQNLLTIMGGEL